jgi:hypothetical protein
MFHVAADPSFAPHPGGGEVRPAGRGR